MKYFDEEKNHFVETANVFVDAEKKPAEAGKQYDVIVKLERAPEGEKSTLLLFFSEKEEKDKVDEDSIVDLDLWKQLGVDHDVAIEVYDKLIKTAELLRTKNKSGHFVADAGIVCQPQTLCVLPIQIEFKDDPASNVDNIAILADAISMLMRLSHTENNAKVHPLVILSEAYRIIGTGDRSAG